MSDDTDGTTRDESTRHDDPAASLQRYGLQGYGDDDGRDDDAGSPDMTITSLIVRPGDQTARRRRRERGAYYPDWKACRSGFRGGPASDARGTEGDR